MTHDLYLFAAGPPPNKNASESTEIGPGTSGTTSAAPHNPTVVDNKATIHKYARRLDKYKAGQSPATVYPERMRSSQPGLSWLGDDEFESTGLAFKLARLHVQRVAANKPAGDSGPRENANKHGNQSSGDGKNDEKTRTRVKTSSNTYRKVTRPKEHTPQRTRPKQAVLEPSPTPQLPAHVDIKSTDFASLFGASPSLSATPSPMSTKSTPTDDTSRRVQLALEYHGGDYSRLVSTSLVSSQGSPLAYAESAMVRRRDLGYNRRNGALAIVRGMINKSPGSQPIV